MMNTLTGLSKADALMEMDYLRLVITGGGHLRIRRRNYSVTFNCETEKGDSNPVVTATYHHKDGHEVVVHYQTKLIEDKPSVHWEDWTVTA